MEVDFPIWRLVLDGKLSSFDEIAYSWSIKDVLTANQLLDARAAMEEIISPLPINKKEK